jgi:hypothetical protein
MGLFDWFSNRRKEGVGLKATKTEVVSDGPAIENISQDEINKRIEKLKLESALFGGGSPYTFIHKDDAVAVRYMQIEVNSIVKEFKTTALAREWFDNLNI